MPRNASGTYTLPTGNPVAPNTIITTDWGNTTMTDIGIALTDSLSRSGKGGLTVALKLIDGTASAPSLTFTQYPLSGLYAPNNNEVRTTVLGVNRFRVLGANDVPQVYNTATLLWENVLTTPNGDGFYVLKTGDTMTGDLTVNANIITTGTVDGRDVSVDGTKLDTVEAGADITDVTNVTAAGAAMLTGAAFTGAITTNNTIAGRDVAVDGTKLDGIQAGADVTDTASVIAAGAALLTGAAFTGAITTNNTIAGRDVAVDGTKLDTVATDATATGENLFINGGFDIWQRDTSFTGSSSVYCADRWLKNGGSTVTRVTDVPSSEFSYAARVDSVGNTAQLRGSVELTETGSAAPFDINASYTFSAWIKAEAADNFELRVSYVDSVSAFSNSVNVLGVQVIAALTTGWTKIVYTIPMGAISPAATNTSLCFSLRMETSDVFFKITGIKFEKGSVATPYQPRPIAEELALCQRYYQIKNIGETFRSEVNVTRRWSVGFMTQMRDVPAITLTMATDSGGATTTGNQNTVNSMELGFTTGGAGTYTKRGSAALDAEL